MIFFSEQVQARSIQDIFNGGRSKHLCHGVHGITEHSGEKKPTAFETEDKGESTLLLPPSQMDFCIISNYSALIYHTIYFYVSSFMTFFLWKFKPFSLILFFYNFLSCENSKEYCHSDIIRAFPTNALFYSYPIRFWRNVHVENLNHKFSWWGQSYQRRGRCLTEPWHSQLLVWGRNLVTWVLKVETSFLGLVCF